MTETHRTIFNRAKPLVKISLTVFFIVLIFSKFDFHAIIAAIRKVSLWLYLVPLAGHFVLMAIKALRWKILLNSIEIQCTYVEALKAYTAGFAFGTFTPGQLGDMGKVMLIDDAKGQRKRAIITSLTDRLWDLSGLLLLSGGCALFLFFTRIKWNGIFLYGLFFCLAALLLSPWIYRFARKLILNKMDTDISELLVNWHWSFFLTLLSLLVQFCRWAVLAVAFNVPVFMASASAIIGTLVALVPISFGGLGTREATIAALFSWNGLDPVVGISFSFLMFGSYLVGALVGVVLLFTYKKNPGAQEPVI